MCSNKHTKYKCTPTKKFKSAPSPGSGDSSLRPLLVAEAYEDDTSEGDDEDISILGSTNYPTSETPFGSVGCTSAIPVQQTKRKCTISKCYYSADDTSDLNDVENDEDYIPSSYSGGWKTKIH